MSISVPANIQQTLQMGPLADKIQHVLQQQPAIAAQQSDEERKKLDELKRTEVQDMKQSDEADATNPEGSRRRQLRIKHEASQLEEDTNSPPEGPGATAEHPHGHSIDLTI